MAVSVHSINCPRASCSMAIHMNSSNVYSDSVSDGAEVRCTPPVIQYGQNMQQAKHVLLLCAW